MSEFEYAPICSDNPDTSAGFRCTSSLSWSFLAAVPLARRLPDASVGHFSAWYNSRIANVLARRLGASLREDVLSRRRKTKTQTRLSLEGKAANVAGAFMVNKGVKLTGCSHVLIVDDVFTTGSTVHECYKALRSLCPPNTRISVATLACVGD